MRRPNDLRDRLRAATRTQHQQVDKLLSTLDLALPRDYVRFLDIHAEALRQLGSQMPPADQADATALLSCVQQDLEFYAVRPPPEPISVSEEPFARRLGIAYVIRGSRLGARVLIDRVAAGAPCTYLRYRPATTWTAFLEALESYSLAQPPESAGDVIDGAKAAFGVFLRAAEFPALPGV